MGRRLRLDKRRGRPNRVNPALVDINTGMTATEATEATVPAVAAAAVRRGPGPRPLVVDMCWHVLHLKMSAEADGSTELPLAELALIAAVVMGAPTHPVPKLRRGAAPGNSQAASPAAAGRGPGRARVRRASRRNKGTAAPSRVAEAPVAAGARRRSS